MTEASARASAPEGYITYAQYLQRQIERPGEMCGPPIADPPAWYQTLLPFLKDPDIRVMEARVREARRARMAEIEAGQ